MDVRNLSLTVGLIAVLLPAASPSFAQTEALKLATPAAATAPTAVPALVPFSGRASEGDGKALTGETSITFLIYQNEQGGEPLFAETQSVPVDATGHFKAQIGASLTNGIPIDLFASGEARWLAVEIAGEAPQPRVLLASVPYALKAADAATLGGLPASAFVLASTRSFTAAALTADVTPASGTAVTTPGGFAGYIPVFTGSSTIANSTIYQNANGIGINAPGFAALDVSGRTIFRGTMVVSRNGNASVGAGVGSVPLQFWANAWNSTIHGPVQPVMQMQAEPTGNNTAAPGATLNLLYNNGTVANATETGLYFNANGTIHFAPAQTFPGMVTPNGVVDATSYNLGGMLFATGSQTTSNVFLGFAGNPSATGDDNTASGFHALHSNTSSSYNTADGAYTLFDNTTGKDNTASGALAMFANTTGSDNTASGFFAMYQNASGYQNTAYGSQALQFNISGNFNTASGYQALYSNTTGNDNTANGNSALNQNTTGDYNTASGTTALFSNTTGYYNTASGLGALYNNTTSSNNTASGYLALFSNTTGNNNTADGIEALESNTTGTQNTASGSGALYSNAVGFGNTANGVLALYGNASGSGNTAIGLGAFTNNTSGGFNTALGYYAGFLPLDESAITGSYDTVVGTNSTFGTGSISNATAIGAYAEVDRSNTLILGCVKGKNECPAQVSVGIGTTTPDALLSVNGTADKPGGGSWGTYSDGRLKTVNGSFAPGLDSVMKLRPIRYRYKADNALGIHDMDEHIGVVAQEVQRVIPEAVTENAKGYLLVNNDPILWSMVNAIKEQQKEIEELRSMLRAQDLAAHRRRASSAKPASRSPRVMTHAAPESPTLVASK